MADAVIRIEEQTVRTTCCYCGVGCGVEAKVEQGKVISVSGDKAHPANAGRLCVKGSSLHETQYSSDRLLVPRLHGEDVSWDTAMDYAADKFRAIVDEHGPDAVAFYLSGQLLTEDYYVANKLMKGFVGTANVDTNSRLCMASATVAHKRAFGADAVPGCYEDLELTDLLVIVGSNMAYAHPIVYQRIVQAKKDRPQMKVVVIDPRRTPTCDIADLHLALRPGADAFLFNGLLTYLSDNDAIDNAFITKHCNGFDEALVSAREQTPDVQRTPELCDVPAQQLQQFYQWFTAAETTVSVFSQGINQSSSGVDKGNAIINCHLATGKIGKPGSCPFSITGQPNAMGGREVGGLANQLAAHMSFDKQDDIDRVGRFWDAPRMAQKEGRKAVDMFQDISDGKIKAVWVMATNPAATMPDTNRIKAALEACELVIVSDCIADTDTAKLANVVLPATTWSEKTGTVTNSERCISLQKGMLPAPGESRHDWEIICDFAARLGYGEAFDYQHQVEIFREHAALSGFENDQGLRAFNISALQEISEQDYQHLSPMRWPLIAGEEKDARRLFEDGQFYTPDRRARLVPVTARYPERTPGAGQFVLNTGRIRDQWHTMSRTGHAAKLFGHADQPYVDMHPDDIQAMGIKSGHLIMMSNANGRYVGEVKAHSGQRRSEVFAPMHWNARFASSSCADALVNPVTDPLSGQPEFKQAPVDIRPYAVDWRGFLMLSEELRYTPATDYWSKVMLEAGVKYRVAGEGDLIATTESIREAFPQFEDWVELVDNGLQYRRIAAFQDGRFKLLLHLQRGEEACLESAWLDKQLGEECDRLARYGVLAGSPGKEVPDQGRIICSCHQVGENPIIECIVEGARDAEALGGKLRCGTNCGSCIPELNELISQHAPQAAEKVG